MMDWKEEKLQSCIVYKATKAEKLMARIVPYLPFVGRRTKVRLRNLFRHAYQRRLMQDLTEAMHGNNIGLLPPTRHIEWTDWEWEVIPGDKENTETQQKKDGKCS